MKEYTLIFSKNLGFSLGFMRNIYLSFRPHYFLHSLLEMYTIHINNKPLRLVATDTVNGTPSADLSNMIARYSGRPKSILNYHDLMEKNQEVQQVTLFADDVDQLFNDFKKLFQILEAGGGVVYNDQHEVLLIFRRDHWDLPKGKTEEGEDIATTALREVDEETKAQNLALGPFIKTTYHTYRNKKNKRILKVSHWYRMTADNTPLIPQTEEDIEQAIWADLRDFLDKDPVIWANVKEILEGELT
jgi:ADP-ribose pyrophosphatase YjhB (NUDIX family)